MLMGTERWDCPFCLTEEAFGVRVDVKSRAYYCCGSCHHRVFVYSTQAFILMGELAKAVTKNRDAWMSAAKAQMAAYFGDRAPAMKFRPVTGADLQRAGLAAAV